MDGRQLMRRLQTPIIIRRFAVALLIAATPFGAMADPGQIGEWSAVLDWPLMAIHAHVLPNGKVLAWDAAPDDADSVSETQAGSTGTRVTLWDPVTNEHQSVDETSTILFCAGHAHLSDGNLFTAGGTIGPGNNPIHDTMVFDVAQNTWLRGPALTYPRWYPTVTPLANGDMLITDGFITSVPERVPEIFRLDGQIHTLPGANLDLPLYPWMQVGPLGKVLYAGPESSLRYLDTSGQGSWQYLTERDGRNRSYGTHAMYDVGKVLIAGGGASLKTAIVIDLNNGITVSPTGSMKYGRRQHNATILLDGSVLVTGGIANGANLVDVNAPVYAPELWNPTTGQWTEMASEAIIRQYHSTALLLLDGTVLSAGGGFCGSCESHGYHNKDAQVFSPFYLFKKDGSGELAPRPEITGAPTQIIYRQSFLVDTSDPANIGRVALVRLGSVTHSNNMEQRYVPLSFVSESGVLNVTAPANGNIAPPGHYMLTIIDASGTPSVAKIIEVQSANTPPSARLSAAPLAGPAPLAVVFDGSGSSDAEGDQLTYRWNFGDGTTATGVLVNHTYTLPGSYQSLLTVTDPFGAADDSDPVTITVSEPGPGSGLHGHYYNNSDFTALKVNRVDATVNFIWGTGRPASNMGPNSFSIRWIGWVRPAFSETYKFYTRTDDGVRLWVNGQQLINKWINQSAREWSGEIALEAGKLYSIRMDYYENTGSASAKLSWSSPRQRKEVIPVSGLYPVSP
ncbi:MAG: PA14 domain-containing protein [Gammaproteobacteria bacterium]